MSQAFIAEIRIFANKYAPRSWALCNGQLLPTQQNPALYSLLGTTYGSNGNSEFGLPNMQGCMPVGAGQGIGLSSYLPGQTGGAVSVTLDSSQVPGHNHSMNAQNTPADNSSPSSNVFSQGSLRPTLYFGTDADTVTMSSGSLGMVGGGGPHNNMSPYVAMNFCICLQGQYPQRS